MKPKESEKTLEARLVREIEARGGMALKYTSQYHRGIPDRIVLMPYGRIYFVELKSTGKTPTKLQVHAMRQLQERGFIAWVVDDTAKLEQFLLTVDVDQFLLTVDVDQGYFRPIDVKRKF